MRLYFLAAACLVVTSLRAEQPAASLPNPGFEEETQQWGVSKDDARLGLSKITAEAARGGQKGLRVEQEEGGPGSWFQSRRMAVTPGVTYRIEFWARTINTSNAGVWIHFFDSNWKPIAQPGRPPFSIQILPESTDWTVYRLDVLAPVNAQSITLAVRCNKQQSTLADFDDFSITPIAPTPASP